MSTESDAGDDAGPTDDAPTDEHAPPELTRGFVVEASGPVTSKATRTEHVTETAEATATLERRITDPVLAANLYELHNRANAKAHAIRLLLNEEDTDDGVSYDLSQEQVDAWEVEIDGAVAAFRDAMETWATWLTAEEGITGMSDTKRSELGKQLADKAARFSSQISTTYSGDGDGKTEALKDVTEDLHRSDLWGAGASLAYMDARNTLRETVGGKYAEQLKDALTEESNE